MTELIYASPYGQLESMAWLLGDVPLIADKPVGLIEMLPRSKP
jgi:hypothetical protein